MRKKKEKVAVVNCRNYGEKQVERAVREALRLLDFDTDKFKKILIKPNVLGAYDKNQEAITTNPEIVRAVMKQFKGKKIIGDSSFMDTENAFKKAGYKFRDLVVFEQSKLIEIHDRNAKVLKKFYLPKIINEVDLVINISKMKTHTLTKITGAIKNLYGCIPGGMKQVLHRKAQGDEKFSSLLIDIYQNIKPELNIMDAVIGMEGQGPSSGKPKEVDLILASRNAVALDVAATKIMCFRPKTIGVIREAVKRKLGRYKIKVVGVKKLPKMKFEKPSMEKRGLIRKALRRLVRKNPIIVDEEKCIRCGVCTKKCPVKAITLKPYPVINKKKCIRCFCCIEVCPRHALYLKETSIRKLLRKMKRSRKK